MFTKIIVAEDIDTISHSVTTSLKNLGVGNIAFSPYCDEALLKIRKAAADGAPFELLITDLSFRPDHRTVKLASGEELLAEVKKLFPEMKIIVMSIEDRSWKIRSFFDEYGIDGYILKSRKSIPDLEKAVAAIYGGGIFLSDEIAQVLKDRSQPEIGSYEKTLLQLLAQGLSLEQIVSLLRNENITPNSPSSVEKNINKLKTYFRANNNVHLIAMAKDFGIL